MRKSIVSIILCLTLGFGSTAHALFIPAIVPVIAIGAGALIAAGLNLGVLYGMLTSDGTSHLVNSSGDISRKAEAKYIEIDMSKLPVVKTVPVHAKMPFQQVTDISNKKNTDGSYKFPSVHAALQTTLPEIAASPEISPGSNVGKVCQIGSTWYSLTSYAGLYTGFVYNPPERTAPFIQSGYIYVPAGLAKPYYTQLSQNMAKYSYVTSSPPAQVPAPVPKSVKNLTGSESGGSVADSALQAELDRMFQDSDYVPSFTDDGTGLPYSPPAGLPSADQIKAAVDTYNRNGALADSRANVQSADSSAVSAAQGAADSAHAAAQQAAAAAAANPGDASLANAYAKALADAAAADAALAKAKADQAKSDNAFTNMSANTYDNTSPVKPSAGGGTADGLGTLILNRLRGTGALLATHAPISYITGIVDAISSLVVDPVAPSMDLPLGFFGSVHISASWFDPLASLTRFFSWLLFLLSAAWSFKGYWHRS